MERTGTNLAIHDANQVSPAAQLAFQQAIPLAPQHPAPYFFYGTALVKAGRFSEARPLWLRARRLTPETQPYKRDIGIRILLLDRDLETEARVGYER